MGARDFKDVLLALFKLCVPLRACEETANAEWLLGKGGRCERLTLKLIEHTMQGTVLYKQKGQVTKKRKRDPSGPPSGGRGRGRRGRGRVAVAPNPTSVLSSEVMVDTIILAEHENSDGEQVEERTAPKVWLNDVVAAVSFALEGVPRDRVLGFKKQEALVAAFKLCFTSAVQFQGMHYKVWKPLRRALQVFLIAAHGSQRDPEGEHVDDLIGTISADPTKSDAELIADIANEQLKALNVSDDQLVAIAASMGDDGEELDLPVEMQTAYSFAMKASFRALTKQKKDIM